jgi:hypothetical protein
MAAMAALVACSASGPGADAGSEIRPLADAATSTCERCGERINAAEAPDKATQSALWLAWAYVPSCSFEATRIAVRSNSRAVGLLGASAAGPDVVLVDETTTEQAPDGWRVATIPATRLEAGRTYFVALKNTEGGIDSTLAATAKAGRASDTFAATSSQLAGGWMKVGAMPHVFGVGASCL